MNKIISILLILCLAGPAFAADEAIPVKKGQAAPIDGFVISPEKTQKIYQMKIELDSQKKINSLLTDEEAIYDKRLTNAHNESDVLAKELAAERDKSIISKMGYFLLGAIVTGGIAYGLSRSLR